MTLKPPNRFLYAAYRRKEETFGFPLMYKNDIFNWTVYLYLFVNKGLCALCG